MPNHNEGSSNLQKHLVLPKNKIKLQYRNIPTVRPKDNRTNDLREDIEKLISDVLRSANFSEVSGSEVSVKDAIKQISKIELTAEDSFTSGKKLLASKYAEKRQIVPKSLRIISADKKERSIIKLNFGMEDACAFSSPGLKRTKGRYPENTDGVVISDNPDKSLTALIISNQIQNPSASSITNAATVYAANEIDIGKGETFPLNFNDLKIKIAPISDEIGIDNPNINGLMARLDLNTYALDVSGNSDKIQCLVIDPASGAAETYQEERQRKFGDESVQKGKQLTIKIPVSSGEIVLMASDSLVLALKNKENTSGIVEIFTKGLAQGKNLKQICSKIMNTIANKQREAEIEDTSNSLVAFIVP